jgi:hypothetical protein
MHCLFGSGSRPRSSRSSEDGDVLQIRDRDQIRLQDKIILTDGTTVNPDGPSRKTVCVCVMENA